MSSLVTWSFRVIKPNMAEGWYSITYKATAFEAMNVIPQTEQQEIKALAAELSNATNTQIFKEINAARKILEIHINSDFALSTSLQFYEFLSTKLPAHFNKNAAKMSLIRKVDIGFPVYRNMNNNTLHTMPERLRLYGCVVGVYTVHSKMLDNLKDDNTYVHMVELINELNCENEQALKKFTE